ncbi:hypothetical protein [Anaerobiospirillum succiniciproducens]|uniref:hypothetical protein n=1 Tax=Anaerobiospirillum succiniciproducens TaxID=13335 RepID=UPI002943AFDC|nr:hypothetical protein [Anaerobiospirillum succiniciproducens]
MEEYRTRTPILKTILTTSPQAVSYGLYHHAREHHTACITTLKNITRPTNAKLIRLESYIRNQSNVAVNKADARSHIRDANFAKESANLSQQSIINRPLPLC